MQLNHLDEPSGSAADHSSFVLDALGAVDYELNLAAQTLRPSPRLNAFFGYPAGQPLTLEDIRSRFHPADRATIDSVIADVLARGEPRFQHELRLVLPDGTTRWVLSRGAVVVDGAGRPALVRGVAIDITERKQLELALRVSKGREAFLLTLGDTLRDLADPVAIQDTAGRVLGRHLGASRVFYAEVTDEAWVVIKRNFTDGLPPVTGQFRLHDFGPWLVAALRAGQTIVLPDIATTRELSEAERAVNASLGIAARVGVPLVKEDKLVALLTVQQATPRPWSDVEVALIEETAERTWAAVERARAEASLRTSEAKYRTLFESIDEGFCIIEVLFDSDERPVDYRFLEVNPSFARQTGIEDAVGRTVREIAPQLEEHWFAIYGRVALTGEPRRFEQPARALGHFYEVYAFRVGAPEERRVAILFNEISARKRAEAALRASEERLQRAMAIETVGILFFNLDGRILDASPAFERMSGYRREDLQTWAHWKTLTSPEFWNVTARAAGELAERGETAPYEKQMLRPDGSRWWGLFAPTRLSGSGDDSMCVEFIIDITERKGLEALRAQAEAAAVHRSEQLQRLAQASTQLQTARDVASLLRIVTEEARLLIGAHQAVTSTTTSQSWAQAISHISLSEKYARWRGYDAKPDGSGIYALVGQTNRPLRLTQAELEAHPAWRGFGSEAAAHPPLRGWLAVPLVGQDGRNLGLIQLSDKEEGEFTADDEALLVQLAQMASVAFENHALYAQEQAARAQAEEASRLKDEFLATLSHELRTPLTAFLGYAQLLQRGNRDAAYVARTVEKMLQSAKAQAALIEDLLDVSRIVSGKLRIEPEPLELLDVISAALDTVRPAVEAKGLQVQVELDPAASGVLGDAHRLQQVVWNLLSNATKFTRPGGQIAIRLAPAEDCAELSVSDTGQGIDPDFLLHVFERFRQADSSSQRAHGGLGLGLAIVRHLVELHGGSVEARSAGVGHGATFTVRLPLTGASGPFGQAPPAAIGDDTPDVGQLPLSGLRVLGVDDQPAIRELLTETLAADGAAVQTCATAQEALSLLRSWRPDLLVSDIAMPQEDGYWLIEQVRSLSPDEGGATPAVALTAYVRMEDRLRVMAAGFQQYLPKPIDAAELRNVILSLISKSTKR